MRIDRMLSITVMLLNRDRISARELADKFEVSVRTVYRDIEAINMAGIPVISYSGTNGGFGIMENFTIDRQLLSLSDMLGILTALKGVNTALDDLGLDSAIEKINSLVPKEKSEELNLRFEQMVIDIIPWGFSPKYKNLLKQIQSSIAENILLEINYRNAKGEHTVRIIEPMTLLLKGYTWYVFAFCRLKNEFRIFRLSRISAITPIPKKFNRRNESYKNFASLDSDPNKSIKLILKFLPEVRVKVEDFFNEDQITIQKNGDIIVKVFYPEDEWLYSMILSYGENVEVIEPLHIRTIIQKKAKKILSVYKPDIMVSQP